MKHVVLLGDLIFDNAAYVPGGPDVIRQLRERLPGGWRATLKAVDGNVIADISRQIQDLPADASHLVLSVGGNDILGRAGLLDESARSVAEALARISDARDQFARDYRAMLGGVAGKGLPLAVCTIYDARFPDPQQRRVASTGLAVFNDSITREAFSRGLPVIDLRLICNDDADFANPIEPSVQGGRKIAEAIAALLAGHDFAGAAVPGVRPVGGTVAQSSAAIRFGHAPAQADLLTPASRWRGRTTRKVVPLSSSEAMEMSPPRLRDHGKHVRQADAFTRLILRPGAPEQLEHALSILLGNAPAVVRDLDADPVARLQARSHIDAQRAGLRSDI